jgi:uncharacterized membrane protein YcjF (UPF0283 family)
VTDRGDAERARELEDRAYDDALAEQLEDLERHSSEERRSASFFRFAGLAGSLLTAGIGAAASALDANKDQFSNVPWTALLFAAAGVAALVLVLAALSSQAARLREVVRAKGDHELPAAVSDVGMRQIIHLHNHLVQQQQALHHSIRRRQVWR